MESIVQDIAERRVQELAYKSFDDLAKAFREDFKIEVANASQKKIIIEAIEVRNISIHNQCIINKTYCSKTGTERAKVGCVKMLDFNYFKKIAYALAASAICCDNALSAKFSIGTISIESNETERGLIFDSEKYIPNRESLYAAFNFQQPPPRSNLVFL